MLRERGWTGFVERDLLETDNGAGSVKETAGFYGTSDIPVVSVCGGRRHARKWIGESRGKSVGGITSLDIGKIHYICWRKRNVESIFELSWKTKTRISFR